MRKKFTTYIEEESIAWLKREALKQEIATGRKVSAADIINSLIEKERKTMKLTHKNLTFAYEATNLDPACSDLEFEANGMKYISLRAWMIAFFNQKKVFIWSEPAPSMVLF